MKQKTVRFYEDISVDMQAYEKLKNYREYGFLTEREMIIASINEYGKDRDMQGIDVDKLANLLISKMSGVVSILPEESQNSSNVDTNILDRALNFIDSL